MNRTELQQDSTSRQLLPSEADGTLPRAGSSMPGRSTSDEQKQVMGAVYEHLRTVYDDDIATQKSYAETVHRLMTVQGVLFASMAFAFGQVDWVESANGVHGWVLISLAVPGGLLLATAFAVGIKGISIRIVSAVGVSELGKTLKDGRIRDIRLDELHQDLSINLANAIDENQNRSTRRQRLSRILNWCTVGGFLFAAAFVGYAVIDKVLN